MESENITPQEYVNLLNEIIRTIRCTSDETILELGLVRNVDHKQSAITYSIADKHKWLLAKIKYGI